MAQSMPRGRAIGKFAGALFDEGQNG